MKLSEDVLPISYLKAHASELIKDVCDRHRTLVITSHGESRAVVQDVESYENMQESLALLKILSISSSHVNEGKTKPMAQAFADIRSKVKAQ